MKSTFHAKLAMFCLLFFPVFNVANAISTTWNGSTWSSGTPTSTEDAFIASNNAPASFPCKTLTINNGFALTTTGITVTVYGNITNNGNGFTGTGTIVVAASSSLNGSAFVYFGRITVSTGAVLTTNDKLTLGSDASSTGSIGNSAGSISGNVTVQRYIPGGRRAYRFLSHPFSNSLPMSSLTDDIDITGNGGSPFTPTANNTASAYYYNTAMANGSTSADAGWQPFTSTSTFDSKTGYRIFIRGSKGQTGSLSGGTYTPDPVTLDWTGTLNTGQQVVSITKGSGSIYAFVGNPFASAIDMSLLTRGPGIATFYYIWSPTSGTRGAFIAKLYSGSYIMPSGSAFITAIASSSTITFNESAKSTGTPAAVLRNNGSLDQLIMEVNDQHGNYADKLELVIDNNNKAITKNNETLWDAEKLLNPDANIYSFSKDGKKQAIDSRPLENNDTVQLGFTNTAPGSFTFNVQQLPKVNGQLDIFLRDKWLNTTTKLEEGQTINVQITNDAASQGNERFELIAKASKLVMLLNQPNFSIKLLPNPVSDNLRIEYDGLNADKATSIKIVDMNGRLIKLFKLEKISKGTQSISMKGLGKGNYSVQLENDGNISSQSILLQ